MIKRLLHIEGLAILLGSLYVYHSFSLNWILFFVLLLAPDVAMVGYLINTKVGARLYNLFHTYSVPIILCILGVILTNEIMLAIGLIWFSHIGMDRMFGFGLKYETSFKDTHFNRV